MIVKNVEKKEDHAASFQVETDAAEFEKALNAAYLKNRRDIYIPGFRKGKAPRSVVEGMYGPEVFYQDALEELLNDAFAFGVEDAKLRIVGAPALDDTRVTDERTAEYSFSVTLYPEVSLGQYKGLEAEKDAKQVSDEQVDGEIESVRRRNARMLGVDDREARMGDTVNIDFDGFLEGERFDGGKAEGYSLELGSNAFVPGFEDQVVGMKIGEEKDLNVTFPTEYVEDLAGKDVVFKVKLNGITTPELPELDDEFAKDVSEFDTLDEYKADVRARLQKSLDEQAQTDFRAKVLEKACENMSVDIPPVMVEEKIEEIVRNYAANFGFTGRDMPVERIRQMLGLNDETMEQTVRPGAEAQVRTELLLDAVVRAEDIQVSDEELEEYIKTLSESLGGTAEQIRSYLGEDFILAEKKKEKASELIVESAVAQALAEEKAE